MKSVAIITIQDYNYGNRLQNYALQELLKSYGLKVVSLKRGNKPGLKDSIRKVVRHLISKMIGTISSRFDDFNQNIKFADIYLEANNAPVGLSGAFDYFVVGSDQVWNPNYDIVGIADLLYFTKKEKKISYAASFGVKEISEDKKREFREYLSDFAYISVREDAGKEIVEQLTGRIPCVVLDPTLMLSKDKWTSIAKKMHQMPKNKYVFVYFLGPKNDAALKSIQQYKRNGFEIYDILSLEKNGHRKAIGPSEFLYLIEHSCAVLTDSFHATVFSIIYFKEFIVYNRSGMDMSSRIITLAKMLNMQLQHGNNGILLCCDDVAEYEKINKSLDNLRAQSDAFLRQALEE